MHEAASPATNAPVRSTSHDAPLTIVGAGAIGGLAAAYIARSGGRVQVADVNAEHVAAINDRGLVVNGLRGPFTARLRAYTLDELPAGLGLVALACKSQHTLDAVRAIAPKLAADGAVVSLQNGFNEEVIAAEIGAERTIGALPDYGGAYLSPGVLEHTSDAPLYLGELDGLSSERLQRLSELFGLALEVVVTDDIWARLWAKEVYGLQVTLSALVDAPTRYVMGTPLFKGLAAVAVREGLTVTDAAGVVIPDGKYFEAKLYRDESPAGVRRLFDHIQRTADLLAKHKERQEAGGYTYTKKASGIWWDIVYRKRKSEVAWLSGHLVAKARELGVEVPVTEKLCEMIYEIEEGRRRMNTHNLDELAIFAEAVGRRVPSPPNNDAPSSV